MKGTKCINSKGLPKGAFVYSIKKDGSRYAKPTFYQFIGFEKNAGDVIQRLMKLNPGRKYEIA